LEDGFLVLEKLENRELIELSLSGIVSLIGVPTGVRVGVRSFETQFPHSQNIAARR
jgi:hypothetical protein